MSAKKRQIPVETRIFGVAAHIDAGKTTVSERMLYVSGIRFRPGLVDEGTSTMDWEEEERERGITIHSAVIQIPWKDRIYTLVDTPGHVDFTVEVERCMRVLDGVVIVFDASRGVEAQSEAVWRQATANGVVRLAFLNKMDKVGADWEASLESIRTRLGAEPVSLQLPWTSEDGAFRLVDLLERRLYRYEGERADAELFVEDWPEGRAGAWEEERLGLAEAVASRDEELLELFVEDERVPAPALRAALRRQTLAGTLLPVLGGAALRGIGVEPLLDAVGDFLPRPSDPSPARARREGTDLALSLDPMRPLAARIFKLVATRHGAIAWVRIFQGRLEPGDQVRNSRTGRVERVQGLSILLADSHENLDQALPGQIVALKGLRWARTGDGLSSPKDRIEFPSWSFPLPVISMAVEARRVDDRDRLMRCLELLAIEDPTMTWRINEETGQLLVSGMGELHLQILASKLRKDFGLDVLLGPPRVAHRESLLKPLRLSRLFERKLPNRDVAVRLDVEFLPNPAQDPPVVEDLCEEPEQGRAQFKMLRETALRALQAELSAGPAHGFPMSQIRAHLLGLGGVERGVLPRPEDLEIGMGLLVRELGKAGSLEILEPWMEVRIEVPEPYLSPVLGDVQAHAGQVQKVEVEGSEARILAKAPLSRMLDFTTRIRSQSQGRGTYAMVLDRYRPVGREEKKRLLGGS